MTTTRASLRKSLKGGLKRGGILKVGETYPRHDLQGKELSIASKGVTVCNGKGRCASDAHCIGFAVFLTDPAVPPAEKEGKVGWRHGTVKVCLTHLTTTEDRPLIPQDKPLPARAPSKSAPQPEEATVVQFTDHIQNGNGGSTLVGVTWQQLAEAHADKNVDLLATYCRRLKAEHEKMALRLVNTQAKLLEGQESSSELRSVPRVRSS